MHSSAQTALYGFIKAHEGEVSFMYLDTKGLVTIGIGNLIDPVGAALTLPFEFKAQNLHHAPAGRPATEAEIDAEWNFLKNHAKRAAFIHGGHRVIEPYTSLELSAANRQQLFENKSADNQRKLRRAFVQFDQWPADAQLGLMAMAWGLGPAFPPHWPNFSRACRKPDFDAAAHDSHISTWRLERNAASRRLFGNAARVVKNPDAYAPATLYYPTVLLDTITVTG
jgi:hypothetical protein